MKVPTIWCEFCWNNHAELCKAEKLAPQKHDALWVYVPVCLTHAEGWWEGSDTPKSKRLPILTKWEEQ